MLEVIIFAIVFAILWTLFEDIIGIIGCALWAAAIALGLWLLARFVPTEVFVVIGGFFAFITGVSLWDVLRARRKSAKETTK